jgi:hypothetical protein
MNEKQLAKLIRKTTQKAEQIQKSRKPKKYDATAPVRDAEEGDVEREAIFKEMKRREF